MFQVRESDVGNYTCVAENVVNRRLSPPAKIDIFGKNLLLILSKSSENNLYALQYNTT